MIEEYDLASEPLLTPLSQPLSNDESYEAPSDVNVDSYKIFVATYFINSQKI